MTNTINDVIDKLSITEALHRYCHGVDRCDATMLKSAYWEDATDDHGSFTGQAMDFVDALIPALQGMTCTSHQTSNILIELRGETAKVESYCVAYHQMPSEDGPLEMVVGGRYLDRMEKRGDEWRIAHRLYVLDWNRMGPSSSQFSEGLMAMITTRGTKNPHDPYDKFMAK